MSLQKKIGFLLVLFSLLGNINEAGAKSRLLSSCRETSRLVGVIQSMERNRMDILDEDDKRTKSFVYMSAPNRFSIGERVRIYYSFCDNVIERIKTMTPVDYHKEGQNLGYIYKKSE